MAFTQLQIQGIFTTGTASVAATTAGSTLVMGVTDNGLSTTQPTYTFPAGWVHITNADSLPTGGKAYTQLWYYPNNPGGITSIVVTGGAGTPQLSFIELGGAAIAPLDVSGHNQSATTVTSLAVATSAVTTAAHEAAVVFVSVEYASATKTTLSAGSGFTQANQIGNGVKQVVHQALDSKLDTGASGLTITDTEAFSTAAGPVAASIATFKQLAAPSETIHQDFEGGTSGNAVATTDTQGTGDTAFDAVQGSTIAYDNAHAAHGTLSAEVNAPTTACALIWKRGGATDVWYRAYLYFAANPSPGTQRIISAAVTTAAISGSGNSVGDVEINTSGNIVILTNFEGFTLTFTNAIPLNSWFRLEGHVTSATSSPFGTHECKLFLTPDSTTADETHSVTGTTLAQDFIESLQFGALLNASNGTYWMDDLGYSTTGYLGPAVAAALPSRPVSINQAVRRAAFY